MSNMGRLACAAGLVALAFPVAAQSGGDAGAARPHMAEGVAILSGGVGDASKEEMKQAATDYNVRLVFSNRRGEYLADIPYTVTDARKRAVVSGTSDGPLLYLRLPPGRYEISAKIGGNSVTKRIEATAGSRARDINVVGDDS